MGDATRIDSDFTFKNHPSLPIAIVGGGLCGLALAIGLVKHGINVRIYESAPAFSEIGAGVAFGINSITALKLIDPRLLAGYKKHATFNAEPARRNTFFTMRWGTDSARLNGPRAGDVAWDLDDVWHPERTQALGVQTRSCIHRAHLLSELISLLPEGITTFNKSFTHATSLPDKTLILHFTDGSTVHCAALLGCDGIKSHVRQHVCPDVKPAYARETAYRAVVPRAAAIAALGEEYALNGHVYCGYGGYIITYPISLGEQVNIVAIPHGTSETWDHGDEWTVPCTREEIVDRLKKWYQPIVQLLAEYRLPTKWGLFVIQHNNPYTSGRVALVGDAAHATVPHLGAGAGMAMEDAYVLSSLINAAGGVENIEKAFAAYDAVRRDRTQEVVRRSLEAGQAYGFALGSDDEGEVKSVLEESFERIWGVDLEGEVRRSMGIMGVGKGGELGQSRVGKGSWGCPVV
ncbi:mannitol 1-phosphate dehydrogenase [Phaeosphaeriaceae sp. SRC1lsM3a]|nr:mannitol 1-phosphate dehydrogenase [Stagonospora sp. SRC1lsM3a]